MALAQFTDNTNSDFFKPADYSEAVALLFSPKEVRLEKNPFDDGDRKVAYAHLAAFNDYDDLDNLKPVDLGQVAVTNGILAEYHSMRHMANLENPYVVRFGYV